MGLLSLIHRHGLVLRVGNSKAIRGSSPRWILVAFDRRYIIYYRRCDIRIQIWFAWQPLQSFRHPRSLPPIYNERNILPLYIHLFLFDVIARIILNNKKSSRSETTFNLLFVALFCPHFWLSRVLWAIMSENLPSFNPFAHYIGNLGRGLHR